ncbi:MAG: hypothetical protein HQL58_09650 [Magnetococcales bacterium]|nr:hypothetical protein [Magnetococcales bacterium]
MADYDVLKGAYIKLMESMISKPTTMDLLDYIDIPAKTAKQMVDLYYDLTENQYFCRECEWIDKKPTINGLCGLCVSKQEFLRGFQHGAT